MKHKVIEVVIYIIFLFLGSIVWVKSNNLYFLWFGLLLTLWPIIKVKIIAKIIAKIKGIKPAKAIHSSSFWYDGFLFCGSPVLKRIREYAALSAALDIIYNYFQSFGIKPKGISEDWWTKISSIFWINFLVKKWTEFWLNMPIAQDVRERLRIVSETVYRLSLNKSKELKILSLAGGANQDVLMAIKKIQRDKPKLEITLVTIEPDGIFGIKRCRELIKILKIKTDQFQLIEIKKRVSLASQPGKTVGDVLSKHNYFLDDFDIILCIGLGDYVFGKDNLQRFLKTLKGKNATTIVANISGNYIERFFLHIFIQWPWMQYLSKKSFSTIVCKAFSSKNINLFTTKNKIFNIAVIAPSGRFFKSNYYVKIKKMYFYVC